MSPHSKRYQSLDPKGFDRMRDRAAATQLANGKPRKAKSRKAKSRKASRRGWTALLHALCYVCSGYGR